MRLSFHCFFDLIKRSILTVCFGLLSSSAALSQIYNITDFGAIGNGTADNTAAIQKAVDECAKTGGKVVFPSGTFLSGTIILKSNVTLSLSKQTILLGNTDIKKYPYLESSLNFYRRDIIKQALIFAKNAENVTIEGEGVIDGQGASFKVTNDVIPERFRNRPYLLWFVNCKNVAVKDVSLRNSAFWMQHYLGCEFVYINNIKVWNHSNKNNDMMDIDGCKNVVISNVTGDSDDDGITLKSTSPLLTENVTITNCLLSSHCSAIKFGTESTGGFRNIAISNCVIRPSKQQTTKYGVPKGISGVALEIVDGGLMENVAVNNLIIEGPKAPLFIRLGNRARPYTDSAATPPVGRIKNINISNIIATGADSTGCSFTGIKGYPIENISLSNIHIETNGGGTANDMFKKVEEIEAAYPEATMFGKLPAYGFYIKHAKGVKLSGITLRSSSAEDRPAMVLSDVNQFSLTGLDVQSSSLANAAIYVNGSTSGLIANSIHNYPAKYFLWKDSVSDNIVISNIVSPQIKTVLRKER